MTASIGGLGTDRRPHSSQQVLTRLVIVATSASGSVIGLPRGPTRRSSTNDRMILAVRDQLKEPATDIGLPTNKAVDGLMGFLFGQFDALELRLGGPEIVVIVICQPRFDTKPPRRCRRCREDGRQRSAVGPNTGPPIDFEAVAFSTNIKLRLGGFRSALSGGEDDVPFAGMGKPGRRLNTDLIETEGRHFGPDAPTTLAAPHRDRKRTACARPRSVRGDTHGRPGRAETAPSSSARNRRQKRRASRGRRASAIRSSSLTWRQGAFKASSEVGKLQEP